MKKVNAKKKQQLKNVGTATALTITLATSNVPTLAYAGELEAVTNEEAIVEEVTETVETKEITEETVIQEKTVTEDSPTQEVERQTASQQAFNLSDWEFNIYSSDIILNKYKGSETDLVIPGKIEVTQDMIQQAANYNPGSSYKEGFRRIKMGTLDSTKGNDCFSGHRGKITSLKFEEVDGQKVLFSVNSTTQRMYKDAFTNLTAMRNIDLSGADVAALPTDMSGMFSGCSSLEEANLNGINLEEVTDMSKMFNGCTSLISVDLRGVNLRALTNMTGMFSGCTNLRSVNLSGTNLKLVTSMANMFYGCTSLESVDLSNAILTNLNSITNILTGLSSLEEVNLSGISIPQITSITNIFSGCTNLRSVNLSGSDLSGLRNTTNVFKGLTSLEEINLSNTNMSNVTEMKNLFAGCTSLKSVNLDNLNISSVPNAYKMFENCTSLETVDLSKVIVNSLTDVTSLFLGCSALNDVTLGGTFDTSSVAKFNNMFKDCTSLKNIDLSGLNTTSATYMSYMFSDSGVESLDLSTFETQGVLDMTGMFRNTENLKTIDFGTNFNTSSVTKMSYMFSGSGVESLDLIGFNTTSLQEAKAMFALLNNINILDLSSFDLSQVTNTDNMFGKNIDIDAAGNITSNQSVVKKELLVIATDNTLKGYDYNADGCLPIGLTLDSVGGQFENGVEVLELKTNVIETLDENIINEGIEKVLEGAIPTKDGHIFVSWDTTQPTRTNSIIDKLNTTYYAIWEGEAVTLPDDVPVDTTDTPVTLPDDVPVDTTDTPVTLPDDIPVDTTDTPVTLPDDVPVDTTDTPVTLPDDVPVDEDDTINPDGGVTPPTDDENQEDNSGNSSTTKPGNGNGSNSLTSNPGSNDNPQTGDTGVLGSIGLGLTSILGIFINNRKKKK